MSDESKANIARMVASIGLLIDRAGDEDEILGTAWLIDENKVATCAHLITPYNDNLEALKVTLPTVGETFGVAKALFHPKFNRKAAQKLASDSSWDAVCSAPLQDYNATVLKLSSTLSPLTDDQKKKINQKLTVPAPQIESGLGGNLAEIDFFLVIQTLTNSRKDGLIILSDTRNRPFARMFCQNGRITHAIYRNLINELALYQIVERKFKGNFFFQAKTAPDWQTHRAIVRPPEMLLLEAHRRMDEIGRLTAALGGSEAVFCRAIPWINESILPIEARDTARNLWQYLDGTIPIGALWQLANVDDFAVFYALVELFKTRQIENVEDSQEFQNLKISLKGLKATALPLVAQAPLAPGDEIFNLSVDAQRGSPRLRDGTLLGSLRSEDPVHLLHNMRLLPETCGSPMFKKDLVIGMQCGPLPMDLDGEEGYLQQMLWSDTILECLKDGGELELAKRLTLTGEELVKKVTGVELSMSGRILKKPEPGCREVARVDCPKCGGTSLESARFCKICGHRLVQEMHYRPATKTDLTALIVVASTLAIAAAATFLASQVLAQATIFAPSPYIRLPENPWLKITTYGLDIDKKDWSKIPEGTSIDSNITFHFKMVIDRPCHVYVMAKGPKTKDATLAFPVQEMKTDQTATTEDTPTAKDTTTKDTTTKDTTTKDTTTQDTTTAKDTKDSTTVKDTTTANLPPADKLLPVSDKVITLPASLTHVKRVNGMKGVYAAGLQSAPDDTLILIASESPLNLVDNQDNLNDVFTNSFNLLSLERFGDGIEVPLNKIGTPNKISGEVNPGEKPVYLKRLLEKIPTDDQ